MEAARKNRMRRPLAGGPSFIAFVLVVGSSLATPSFAGVPGLEDEDNAKLARHKAQMKQTSSKKMNAKNSGSGNGSDASDKCGSLEVGNVSNNKPGRPIREVTVIVDGPIINANNKCR